MKRGTKLVLTGTTYNNSVPFVVFYFKKVRNSDDLIEVTFPFEVNGGGTYRVRRDQLTEAK